MVLVPLLIAMVENVDIIGWEKVNNETKVTLYMMLLLCAFLKKYFCNAALLQIQRLFQRIKKLSRSRQLLPDAIGLVWVFKQRSSPSLENFIYMFVPLFGKNSLPLAQLSMLF